MECVMAMIANSSGTVAFWVFQVALHLSHPNSWSPDVDPTPGNLLAPLTWKSTTDKRARQRFDSDRSCIRRIRFKFRVHFFCRANCCRGPFGRPSNWSKVAKREIAIWNRENGNLNESADSAIIKIIYLISHSLMVLKISISLFVVSILKNLWI